MRQCGEPMNNKMFDVAKFPSMAKEKATDSRFSDRRPIFILQQRNAGDTRYLVAARLGQQEAIAPNLHCLARPAKDFFHASSSQAIFGMRAIAATQTAQNRDPETINAQVKS